MERRDFLLVLRRQLQLKSVMARMAMIYTGLLINPMTITEYLRRARRPVHATGVVRRRVGFAGAHTS